MPYNRVNWDEATLLDAGNFNTMDVGIKEAHDDLDTAQHFNGGNTLVRRDAGGRARFSNPSANLDAVNLATLNGAVNQAAAARRSRISTSQSIVNETWTRVTYNSTAFSVGGWSSVSTAGITPPIAGIYQLTGGVQFSAGIGGTRQLEFRLGGSAITAEPGVRHPPTSHLALSISTMLRIDAPIPQMELWVWSGATISVVFAFIAAHLVHRL